MNENPSNRRSGPRFLAGLKATLLLENSSFSCEAVDLHQHGVMVEGDFDPAGHAEAAIRIVSPAEDLSFEARGRVAHVSKDAESGRTKLGIEFETCAPEQADILERLLARIVEGRNPAPLAALKKGASIPEIRNALGKIALPHRMNIARRALPPERAFMKHDESPQVIEALCRNPQLTRAELMELLQMPMFQVADKMIEDLSLVSIRQVIRRPGLKPALKDRLVATTPHKQLQGW